MRIACVVIVLALGLTVRAQTTIPDLPLADLIAAYNDTGLAKDLSGSTGWTRGAWVEAIVAAWLHDARPVLARGRAFAFADVRIGVSAHDFDGDGDDEYLLDVIKGVPQNRLDCFYDAEYVGYLVADATADGYRLVETPVYWSGDGADYSFTNFGEGGQITVRVDDLNADGLPEWVVLMGGETYGGPQMGYENTGRLFVVGWRDGRMVDLVDTKRDFSLTYYAEDARGCDNAVPHTLTWEFLDLD